MSLSDNFCLISIIIPLYNKQSVIQKTIDSILCQKYTNFEVIVVDDGSTDNSVQVVRSYDDPRIRIYQKKNGGPSSARNYGVKKSVGEWVIFLDADDTFVPEALTILFRPIKKDKDIDIVSGNFNIVSRKEKRAFCRSHYEGLVPNIVGIKWIFLNKCYPRTGAAIIQKNVLLKYPFDEKLRRFEDISSIIQWVKNSKIYVTPEIVFNYYRDTANYSNPCKDYNHDFIFHMDFKNASFWEKLILGNLYGSGIKSYPAQKQLLQRKYGKWDFYRYLSRFIFLSRLLYIRILNGLLSFA